MCRGLSHGARAFPAGQAVGESLVRPRRERAHHLLSGVWLLCIQLPVEPTYPRLHPHREKCGKPNYTIQKTIIIYSFRNGTNRITCSSHTRPLIGLAMYVQRYHRPVAGFRCIALFLWSRSLNRHTHVDTLVYRRRISHSKVSAQGETHRWRWFGHPHRFAFGFQPALQPAHLDCHHRLGGSNRHCQDGIRRTGQQPLQPPW